MITIVGAGSWGTALCSVLASNKHSICIYGRDQKILKEIQDSHTNSKYLGSIKLFDNTAKVAVSTSLEQSITADTKYIVIAVPSDYFAATIQDIKQILMAKKLNNIAIINTTKGLAAVDATHAANNSVVNNDAHNDPQWLHQVIENHLGKDYPFCLLSGPSFAQEVASRKPTSIVMVSKNIQLAQAASELFHNNWFRVYTGTDLLGVELGGAVKNILAFAVGCAEGYGFGANARAAIITRGLQEMLQLGATLGVNQATLMGLTGLGDLILTATDNQSRNKRFGIYIGQGLDVSYALKKVGQHVASYSTTKLIYNLVKKHKLDLPIITQAHELLFNNLSLEQAIVNLTNRPQKLEY